MSSSFKYMMLILAVALVLPGTGFSAPKAKMDPDDIFVPPEELEMTVEKEYFEKAQQDLLDKLNEMTLPRTFKEVYRLKDKSQGLVSEDAVFGVLSAYLEAVKNPDLEEATRLPKKWYEDIFIAAKFMHKSAKAMRFAVTDRNGEAYNKAAALYFAALDAVNGIYKNKPKRLSKEKMEVIRAKNKERRRQEYIAKVIAQEKEKEKAAKEKAANRKNRRRAPKKPNPPPDDDLK